MSISETSQLFSAREPSQRPWWSKSPHFCWAIDVLCVAVLVIYFLHFALPAIGGNFNDDEMMNIFWYWHPGATKSLWANVLFWTRFHYRPGGALYYLPLYHFFGLNPQPYRIVQIIILTAAIPMVYYLSRCLASSRFVAFLATLAACYHGNLISLVFLGSFIYDVLCGFFYFAALTFYVHVRERSDELRPWQLAGFLALYICALDFKEMAVTLPVIVLIYELLKCHRWSDWKQFIAWTRSFAAPALIAGLITAPYIYSRTRGPDAMATWPGYRPHYSWSNFLKSNAHFVSELFYSEFHSYIVSKKVLLALWVLVLIYAFLRRDRMLRLMAFWVVIVPLPIAFIVPMRGGPCLYLLLFGYAMIFAKLASDLIALISNSSLLVGQGTGVGVAAGAIIAGAATGGVRSAAIGAAAGAAVGKMSPSTFRIFATVLVALSVAIFTHWENQRFGRISAFLNEGKKTSHVIQAFRSLNLHPAPGSTILVKGNPFGEAGGWQPLLVASLVWNDHSLQIWLDGKNKLTPQQLAKVDYVISLSEFHAEIVRALGSQGR